MDREKLLNRLQNLAALAAEDSGTTEGERTAARRQYDLLCEKYNVTAEELNATKVETNFVHDFITMKTETRYLRALKIGLMRGLARANYCRTLDLTKDKRVFLFGDPQNVATVRKMYSSVLAQMKGLTDDYAKLYFKTRTKVNRVNGILLDSQYNKVEESEFQIAFQMGLGAGLIDRLLKEKRLAQAGALDEFSSDTLAVPDELDVAVDQGLADIIPGTALAIGDEVTRAARDTPLADLINSPAFSAGVVASEQIILRTALRGVPV